MSVRIIHNPTMQELPLRLLTNQAGWKQIEKWQPTQLPPVWLITSLIKGQLIIPTVPIPHYTWSDEANFEMSQGSTHVLCFISGSRSANWRLPAGMIMSVCKVDGCGLMKTAQVRQQLVGMLDVMTRNWERKCPIADGPCGWGSIATRVPFKTYHYH